MARTKRGVEYVNILIKGKIADFIDKWGYTVESVKDVRMDLNSPIPVDATGAANSAKGNFDVYADKLRTVYEYIIPNFAGSTIEELIEAVDVVAVYTLPDGTITRSALFPTTLITETKTDEPESKRNRRKYEFEFESFGFGLVFDKLIWTDAFKSSDLVADAISNTEDITLTKTLSDVKGVYIVRVNGEKLPEDWYKIDAATSKIKFKKGVSVGDTPESEIVITYKTTETEFSLN